MRILYFSKNYTPHDHRFLFALSKTRHEIFYLKLEADLRQVEDRPVPASVEQVHWAGGQGTFRWRDVPRLVLDLKRVIRSIRPDLIHAGPIQTCAFLAVLSGFRPLLTMSWGFDLMEDAERNAWWRWTTRFTLRHSTFFTSDARVTCDRAVAYGMNPGRTIVFPWGVDLRHFKPAPAAARRGSSGTFVIFCNRSWEPRYGVDVLARAFVKVVQEGAPVSLLLLGGGSQARQIRQILMTGGVLDRVQFGGQVPQANLPRWYRMADLYISPSHVDGSSVSLMEALACGLPALVSDIPTNREWVSEGENGWFFPDGDADALAGRILELFHQRRKLARVRKLARLSVEQRADWNRNFGMLLKAYDQAVLIK